MEERDDKQTVEVAFHPPDGQQAPDPRRPQYTVAPTPEPGEEAGEPPQASGQ
jgi:hypothetical protein